MVLEHRGSDLLLNGEAVPESMKTVILMTRDDSMSEQKARRIILKRILAAMSAKKLSVLQLAGGTLYANGRFEGQLDISELGREYQKLLLTKTPH